MQSLIDIFFLNTTPLTLHKRMILRRTIFWVLLGFTALVEAVIILYNHSTGYVPLTSISGFVSRLLFGTLFAFLMTASALQLDWGIVQALNRRLGWDRRPAVRSFIELLLVTGSGFILGILLTLLVHALSPYRDRVSAVAVTNGLIAAVVNLLLAAVLEGVLAYQRQRAAARQAEHLERENTRLRFETLKSQLNPHFLFNSLNVLSSLIAKDQREAQRFVDEFSSVYRYTLEVIDRPVVSLSSELEYARSYMFLQSLRFGNAVRCDIDIPAEALERLLPPLALQTVLENAFKHNIAAPERPLTLALSADGNRLTVRNTLQPRHHPAVSTGVGLKNLRSRYAYLGTVMPDCAVTQTEFIAYLPLIESE